MSSIARITLVKENILGDVEVHVNFNKKDTYVYNTMVSEASKQEMKELFNNNKKEGIIRTMNKHGWLNGNKYDKKY